MKSQKVPESTVIGKLRKVRGGGVIDSDLADRLFLYRADQGLTQQALADKVQIHQSTISEAELGHPLSLAMRARLCRFLNVAEKEATAGIDAANQEASQ